MYNSKYKIYFEIYNLKYKRCILNYTFLNTTAKE